MTWLLVLLAWTACAGVMAPFVGRVLAHGGVISSLSCRPALPSPRHPLVLH